MLISSARFSVGTDVKPILISLGAEQIPSNSFSPVFKLWHSGEILRPSAITQIVGQSSRALEAAEVYDATYLVDRGSFVDVFALTQRGLDDAKSLVSDELNGVLRMPSPKDYQKATVVSVQSEREPRFTTMSFDNEQPVERFTGEGKTLLEVEIPCDLSIESAKVAAAAIREGRIDLKISQGEKSIEQSSEGVFFEQASVALDTIIK